MKIEKRSKFKNKLVKLKLIQTKAYNKLQYLDLLKIEDIEYRLKKICHIIHKYHVHNKVILFVGSPTNVSLYIQNCITNNNHIFFPLFAWKSGILSNKNFDINQVSNPLTFNQNQISKLISKIQRKVDLIVVLEDTLTQDVLHESYISRKPTVLLHSDLNIISKKSDYKMPVSLKFSDKQSRDSIFYILLISILKKRQLRPKSTLNIKNLLIEKRR